MKLKGQFVLLGTEKTQSQDKSKTYNRVALNQGIESQVFYVNDDMMTFAQTIPPMSQVIAEIGVKSVAGKTYFDIANLSVAK